MLVQTDADIRQLIIWCILITNQRQQECWSGVGKQYLQYSKHMYACMIVNNLPPKLQSLASWVDRWRKALT